MAALDQKIYIRPPFASTLIFELYEDDQDKQLYVNTLYNDAPLNIGSCTEKCSARDYITFLDSRIVFTDVKGKCNEKWEIFQNKSLSD